MSLGEQQWSTEEGWTEAELEGSESLVGSRRAVSSRRGLLLPMLGSAALVVAGAVLVVPAVLKPSLPRGKTAQLASTLKAYDVAAYQQQGAGYAEDPAYGAYGAYAAYDDPAAAYGGADPGAAYGDPYGAQAADPYGAQAAQGVPPPAALASSPAAPAAPAAPAGPPAQPPDWAAPEQQADGLLATLSPEDKLALVHGVVDNRHGYAGWVGFKGRYLGMNDGPQGYNTYGAHKATSTQFPCLLAVAASFDPGTATRYATAVAEEFSAKGANVLLGPDVEILRAPLAGRGFETLSGEDPYLGSRMVAPFVQAVQALGIIACVKHWLDNNSEDYRQTMSVSVDARTQHEIYIPVFKAAFDAGAAAVMCSYNEVSGIHACENKELLTQILRNELNFRGFVLSDWGATHDAVRSAEAGLDIDMQTVGQGEPLLDEFHKLPDLVEQGAVTQAMVDEKAKHVLSAMFKVPNLIEAKDPANMADISIDAHREVALQTIVDSAVLLKNEASTLPLTTAGKRIVFVGKFSQTDKDDSFKQGTAYAGGGSGLVETSDEHIITPLEGLQEAIADAAEVSYAEDASGAQGADVAIVVVAAHAEEGWDRQDLTVPDAQALVSAVKGKAQKVVVLAVVPGPVETDWIDGADAVLLLFCPGEQFGRAAARLLTGAAAPGGRLPVSMPKTGENRFTPEQYPGTPFNDQNMVAQFTDGVLVGYRWHDAKSQPAAFPFGFGLTYTDFMMDGFEATCAGGQATVTIQVTNTGSREGTAVPQVYVGYPSMQPALRTLKGFEKVVVPPGGASTVTINLAGEAFQHWDEATGGWVSATAMGEQITISAGSSSADLPFSQTMTCM